MQYCNSLSQNCPNPFNPNTTIQYSIRQGANVTLKIHNVAGRLVKTPVNREQTTGTHIETWNGCGNSGEAVAGSVYFYKLMTDSLQRTRMLVLIKLVRRLDGG
ncbi:MAG: T9SS type A sorting domain-containing protein [Candidatus Latescibacterota bacterium]